MLKPISTLYIALILIVSFTGAFWSLLQISFFHEQEEIKQSIPSLFFAAKLEPGLENSVQEKIMAQVHEFEAITATQIEKPIPPWTGNTQHKEAWQEMWRSYLSPILYATAELKHGSKEKETAAIAGRIKSITGVTTVQWNKEGHQQLLTELNSLHREKSFFSILFFFFMLVIVGGLLASYPIRFRRKYVVLTGFGGAGSQINPEWVWLKFVLSHIIVSIILYCIFLLIGYLFYPFSIESFRLSDFIMLFAQGIFMVAGLVAAVCLVGWWLTFQSVEELIMTRAPIPEWNQE